MKHTYIIFCVSLLLLSLAGCKQDELQSSHQSDTRLTSVRATTSAAVKSRTQLSGNAVIWEQSDAIGIFSNTTAEAVRYDLTEIEGDEARFESETGVSGEEFYAFYPYSAQSAVAGTTVSYRLTDGQDYRAGSFDTGDCPMVAKSTNSDFRFLQTCGIIRLRLTGTMAVSAIQLQGNNGEAIAGDGTIDVASDTPVFRIDGSGDKQTAIQLRTSSNVQLSESNVTEFYFVVAPQTFAQGITVDITGTVNGTEQTIHKQTQKSITVTRSVISSFAAVDTDAELEPEGPTDRDVLIALYDATNGDNWTNNTNWCTDAPLSEWYGVSVDSEGRVTELSLPGNNLVGSIPVELGNLSNLTYLNLNKNQLTGNIPVELGNLSQLEDLDLGWNQLTGGIPVELGNLSNLRGLYLYENQLTGDIPTGLSNLSQLEILNLQSNQLTGGIPVELTNLPYLRRLYLDCNQLIGNIPVELGNLSQLEILNLQSNQLTGGIPVELGNLSNLIYLNLNNNQLTGNIPVELGNLSQLEYLDLGSNQLTGSLPKELSKLENLIIIYIAANNFSRRLSPELTATSWWQKWGWEIALNGANEFDFDTYNLYLPDFTFTNQNGKSVNTKELVESNNCILYYSWYNASFFYEPTYNDVAEIYAAYKEYGMEVLGYCTYDSWSGSKEEELACIENHGMEWPVMVDVDMSMREVWPGCCNSIYSIVYLFDRNGKLIFESGRELQNLKNNLQALLQQLLEEGYFGEKLESGGSPVILPGEDF